MDKERKFKRVVQRAGKFVFSPDVLFKTLEVALGAVFWWPLAMQSLLAAKDPGVEGIGPWEKFALATTCSIWMATMFLLFLYSVEAHLCTLNKSIWTLIESTFGFFSWLIFFFAALLAINFPHYTQLGCLPMVCGFMVCFIYLFNCFTSTISYYTQALYGGLRESDSGSICSSSRN